MKMSTNLVEVFIVVSSRTHRMVRVTSTCVLVEEISMAARSEVLALSLLLLCLGLSGCGETTAQSPAAGEIERYLQDNPPNPEQVEEEPVLDFSEVLENDGNYPATDH